MRDVSSVLVHHPIWDRQKAIVTTAITNLDLHDIARSSHTYGLSAFYVAHPIEAQRELARRVQEHWVGGSGARRIPDRSPAMQCIRIVESLDQALEAVGSDAELWVTSAQSSSDCLSFSDARARLASDGPPVVIAFGTGWGLAEPVLRRATARLEPIRSPRADGYNHLSVRAAAAITFDRLLGPR